MIGYIIRCERKQTMDDIRKRLKQSIELQLDELDQAKTKPDDSKIRADNAVKLTEAYLKTVKGQDDIFNNEADRQKTHAEIKKIKLEAERIELERDKPEPAFIKRNEETLVKVGGTIAGIGIIVAVQELGNRLVQGNLIGKLIP